MKDETKKVIEENYRKFYVIGVALLFVLIIILGAWGFFGTTKPPVKPRVTRPSG